MVLQAWLRRWRRLHVVAGPAIVVQCILATPLRWKGEACVCILVAPRTRFPVLQLGFLNIVIASLAFPSGTVSIGIIFCKGAVAPTVRAGLYFLITSLPFGHSSSYLLLFACLQKSGRRGYSYGGIIFLISGSFQGQYLAMMYLVPVRKLKHFGRSDLVFAFIFFKIQNFTLRV